MEKSSRRRFARYVHVKNWNFLFYCSNIAKSENAMLSTLRRCQDSRERGKGDWHWLFTKKHFDIDCLYHRQGNEQKQVAIYSSIPNLKSPSIRTPSLLKKKSLSISKSLYPFKRVSTSIRRNLFTKDDGNFTADLHKL